MRDFDDIMAELLAGQRKLWRVEFISAGKYRLYVDEKSVGDFASASEAAKAAALFQTSP